MRTRDQRSIDILFFLAARGGGIGDNLTARLRQIERRRPSLSPLAAGLFGETEV
jgi:hypothetical protein